MAEAVGFDFAVFGDFCRFCKSLINRIIKPFSAFFAVIRSERENRKFRFFGDFSGILQLDFIEYLDRSFLFTGIQVAIGVPRHLDVRMTQPSRDLLNVDPFVDEQGSVGVPEIMYPDVRQPGGGGESLVLVFDGRIPERTFTAADTIVFAEQLRSFLLTCLVFRQNSHQRLWYL